MTDIGRAPPATGLLRGQSWWSYCALVLPSAVLLLIFAVPMGGMIGLSFQSERVPGFSTETYTRFATDWLMWDGLLRTVVMSVIVACIVTVLAYPIAYYLARASSRWRTIIFGLVIAPELAGVVLRTYGWLIILEEHGFINNVLLWLGVIATPVQMTKNMLGVIVGLTHVLLPFGVLSLLTSIQGIDPNLEKSAQILGASRLSTLRHIILPLSVPGIVSSFFIAFTLSASAYATPALLGGAGFHVMATMIYEQFLIVVDWPYAAAIATILLVVVLFIAAIGSRSEVSLQKKLRAD